MNCPRIDNAQSTAARLYCTMKNRGEKAKSTTPRIAEKGHHTMEPRAESAATAQPKRKTPTTYT